MTKQKILSADLHFRALDQYLEELSINRILLVCRKSITGLHIWDYFQDLKRESSYHIELFSDFRPNPEFESVVKGVAAFQKSNCDCIIAIGGGSAIDVAKCIKLFAEHQTLTFDAKAPFAVSNCPFISMPTTAGTGSETTRFAVVYQNNEKQSISDLRCIPSAVLFDPRVLNSLSLYQKKSTVLDALCHAIESFWSVQATSESELYATKAIQLILKNIDAYLIDDSDTYESMLFAANLAGKAIDITQTTAGHAMSYKLTSKYGIAHGHAVAICVRPLWHLLLHDSQTYKNINEKNSISNSLKRLAFSMDCSSAFDAASKFDALFESLELSVPHPTEEELDEISNSVNIQRLSNFPLNLSIEEIKNIYRIATTNTKERY